MCCRPHTIDELRAELSTIEAAIDRLLNVWDTMDQWRERIDALWIQATEEILSFTPAGPPEQQEGIPPTQTGETATHPKGKMQAEPIDTIDANVSNQASAALWFLPLNCSPRLKWS